MIILKRHYDCKNTYIFMYKGQKLIANGCQCFLEKELDYVCEQYNISTEQKNSVLNSLSEVTESSFDDIKSLVVIYPIEITKVFSTDYELCKLAVQEDGLSLQYVENKTEEICKLAVQQNGLSLQYVENKTEEICKLSVKQHGYALYYVENQTEELCKLAVRQNGYALKYVINQTPEICKLAVKQYNWALRFVNEEFINLF